MKRNLRICIFAVVIVCLILSISACEELPMQTYSNAEYFGANLSIVCYTDNKTFESVKTEVNKLLQEVYDKIDVENKSSDVYRFNNASDGVRTEISKYTYDLFTASQNVFEITDGYYDPTVFWLADLWGFTARFNSSSFETKQPYDRERNENGGFDLPQEKYITAFAKLTDLSKIKGEMIGGKFYLTKTNTQQIVDGVTYYAAIDFGGIAKGYVIDEVRKIFDKYGIDRGNASYGTSSLCLLNSPSGDKWKLELTNPRKTAENFTYCKAEFANVTVATSGDYERYYETNGKRYCHIIDGDNGYPIDNGVASVTIIGESGAFADALATGLSVLGKEKIVEFTNEYAEQNGLKLVATFINETGEIEVFSNVENLVITAGKKYAS